MTRRILILGHGQQTRLAALGQPKQFLPISETETIVARTIRLASPYGEVSLWAPLLKPWTELSAQVWSVARPGDSLARSIYKSYPLWQQGATILLGDVVFSKRLLDRMHLVHSSVPLVFGRRGVNSWTGKSYGELYAIVVPHADAAAFLFGALPLAGKLWDVLAALGQASTAMGSASMFFREVTDYTDDIDTQDDVDVILPKLRSFAAAEEPS